QAWQRHASSAAVVSGEWRSGQWVTMKDEGGRRKDEVQSPTPQSGAQAASNPTPLRYGGHALQLPIRVRGQTIGEFDLTRAGEWPDWTPEDIAFAQSLVDQVGQTIETARLLEETERLAGRERIVNDINSRVRRTVNLDSIVKTAVNELGRSLGAARVFARIGGLSATIGDDGKSAEGMGKDGDHD
ncbi:MAG: GAF domain-containing protein, partial [Anaerolineae bacterium]